MLSSSDLSALMPFYRMRQIAASFSQVTFDFSVTPELIQMGLTWALVLGFVGGLFPPFRAARLPITTALRGE